MREARPTDQLPVRWALLILAVAVFVTFGNLASCEFTNWDDPHTVSNNPLFQPVTATTFAYYWSRPAFSIYIPLTYSVWAVLAMVAQVTPGPDGIALNPLFYHGANILFHLLATTAAFLLLRRLLHHNTAALLGALVFALHPVQVESVGWVSGLKDVLSGALLLAAMWQYMVFLDSRKNGAYVLALLLVALAMLAKPSAMVAALLLAVMEWLWRVAPDIRSEADTASTYSVTSATHVLKTAWHRLLPFAVLALPIAALARFSQPAEGAISPLWARPLVMMDSISFYLYKLAFPFYLGLDYGRSPTNLIASGGIWYGWVLSLVVLLAVTLLARRSKPMPLAAMLLFVLSLLPVLGLVRFEFQHYSTVADHYLYLPLLGPALLAGWLVTRSGKAAPAILTLLLVIWAARSMIQTTVWHDSFTLLKHADAMNPNSRLATSNLASEYYWTGQLDLAEPYHARSLQLDPDNAVVQANAARIAFRRGRIDEGRAALAKLAGLSEGRYPANDGRHVPGYLRAAEIAVQAGLLADAEQYIRSVEQIAPGDVRVIRLRRWYEKVAGEQDLQHRTN